MENYDDYFKDSGGGGEGSTLDEKLDLLDDPVEFIDITTRCTLEANEKETLCTDFLPTVTLQCDKWFETYTGDTTGMADLPRSTFNKVFQYWMFNYFELLETETIKYTGRTACDILFTLMCKFVIMSEPQRWMINSRELRLSLLFNSLYPLSYELRCLACQHTKESLNYWPSPQEIASLSGKVAQLIVYGLVGDPDFITDLIKKKTKGHVESIIDLLEGTRQKVLSLIESRPETKEEKRAKQREEEEAARGSVELQELLRQKKIQRVSIAKSVQMTGTMWNDDLTNVVNNFIPLSNSVFHTITFHEEMYKSLESGGYTIIDGVGEELFKRYPVNLDLLKWKQYRSNYTSRMQANTKHFSSSTSFNKRMESLCYEMILPLGCKFQHLRKVDTQYTNEVPSQVVELHLGKRTQEWLYHQLVPSGGAYTIAMDPKHIFHACSLLSMMTYDLRQNKKIRFYKDYFVQFTQLYSRFKSHVTNKEVHDAERRPVIFNIKRRVCVSHRDMIILCSSDHNEGLIDAAVLWLFFVLYDYDGELENYINIGEWIKDIIILS